MLWPRSSPAASIGFPGRLLAGVALELERRVLDAETLEDLRPEPITFDLRLVEGDLAGDHDVCRERGHVRCDVPNVHVMDVLDRGVGGDEPLDLTRIEAARGSLHENVCGFTEELPRRPQDEGGDGDRSRRVDPRDVRDDDRDAGRYGAERTGGIERHVQQ